MTGDRPAYPGNQGEPLLAVLSGPSGVGKDAVLDGLRALKRPWYFPVTATTRAPRTGERDGVAYIFLEPPAFQEMVDRGQLMEYAQVYGNWYGVPRQQVREGLKSGLDTILKVDVQGAATIKKIAPEAVFIFLVPSSIEELRERLRTRATESAEDLELRTRAALAEMEHLSSFDYKVVNQEGRVAEAVACVDAIILAEKCRTSPRHVSI